MYRAENPVNAMDNRWTLSAPMIPLARNPVRPGLVIAAIWAALAPIPAAGQGQTVKTQEHTVRVVKVVEGLEYPWALAFLPDGRMLVTERPGRLRIVGKDGKCTAGGSGTDGSSNGDCHRTPGDGGR